MKPYGVTNKIIIEKHFFMPLFPYCQSVDETPVYSYQI